MDQDDNKNINNGWEIDPDYESTHTALRKAEFQEAEGKFLLSSPGQALVIHLNIGI